MSQAQAKEEFVKAMTSEKQATKDEFIDAAVAKFQEVFLKSRFVEATNKLQQRLEKVEKSSNNKPFYQDAKEKQRDPTPRRRKQSNKNKKDADVDNLISKALNLS